MDPNGQQPIDFPRPETELPDVYEHPLFTYYPPTGIVERGGEQFSVLPRMKRDAFNQLFLPNPNRAVSAEEIVGGGFTTSESVGVKVWISQLRKRFSPDPDEAKLILMTIQGKYVFRDETRPVELIQKDPNYVDFHVRVRRERADQFEEILDQFGKVVVARRLEVGAEAVLFIGESSQKRESNIVYHEPEIDPEVPILDGGDFKFDPNRQVLVIGDKNIPLTPNEAKLAYLLMSNSSRVITHEQIVDYLQKSDGKISKKLTSKFLSRLRRKLRENIIDLVDPFENVRGKGVLFHGPPKTEE